MSLKKWVVTICDSGGIRTDYEVEAHTEDGAINRAGDEFYKEYGRRPHETEIISFREGQKC